ncbi:hypothetical protein AB3X52_12285 [Nocardioides sp. DS6]|uniref:Uncharacterized protein n=1 Tax=Nocardioides eburneus TaxID=3231482 RepID=A0ABV3T0T4_9ACTN
MIASQALPQLPIAYGVGELLHVAVSLVRAFPADRDPARVLDVAVVTDQLAVERSVDLSRLRLEISGGIVALSEQIADLGQGDTVEVRLRACQKVWRSG